SFIHECAHGDLVVEASINAGDGNSAALAASLNALPQDGRAIVLKAQRQFRAIHQEHQIVAVGFHANSVHAGIRPDLPGHVCQGLHEVVNVFVVDDFCASSASQGEAILEAVDRNDAFGTKHEATADGELAHGSAAPDRDGVAGFDVAIDRTHVAGGKDV